MAVSETIREAARIIGTARRIVALTGAGISAESGIPTFREAQTGLWAEFSPQDLATPEAFAADPERVWGWYRWRRTLIARGGVNAGHTALATLGRTREMVIATQNVDGLHAAAGSIDIAELHGNIWRERCNRCARESVCDIALEDDEAPLPICTACGGTTRPAVVWFGEALPVNAFARAQRAIADADCILVVGTSNQVYPAASLAEQAVASATPVIEINPQPTGLSPAVDLYWAETASQALPDLVAALDAGESAR